MPARTAIIYAAIGLGVGLGIGIIAGCDKSARTFSGPVDADAAAAPAKAAGDTIAAADPAVKRVSLKSIPLAVNIPGDWTLEPRERPVFLEGTAPDGNIRIAMTTLDTMSDTARSAYIQTAEDQSRRHPQRTQVRQSTTAGGVQILQRIEYVDADSGQSLNGGGTTQPSARLLWSIVAFVPSGQKFIPCEFDLMGLTQQQYGDDQQFVESILDSIEPDHLSSFQ